MQDKLSEATIASNSAEAIKWKNQQRAEEIKAMYRKLRFIRKDSTRQNGLSRLEVPADPTEDQKKCTAWKTIDVPEEITKYLLERNKAHFGQAKGTPFTVSPLNTAIDFSASTATSEMILEGNYSNHELDELTRLFLTHLKHKAALDTIPLAILDLAGEDFDITIRPTPWTLPITTTSKNAKTP